MFEARGPLRIGKVSFGFVASYDGWHRAIRPLAS